MAPKPATMPWSQAAPPKTLHERMIFLDACQKHFEVTHPKAAGVAARPDGVGNHPNAWFKASRIYHKEVHEAKNPDAVKQVAPAAAAAPAPAVLLAN